MQCKANENACGQDLRFGTLLKGLHTLFFIFDAGEPQLGHTLLEMPGGVTDVDCRLFFVAC